jgi:hypothetical protein
VTQRENIGSVGLSRSVSSMAGRSRERSAMTRANTSGRCSSAVSVMPICFQVVPEPAASSSSNANE